jgi:hypothetical protein
MPYQVQLLALRPTFGIDDTSKFPGFQVVCKEDSDDCHCNGGEKGRKAP